MGTMYTDMSLHLTIILTKARYTSSEFHISIGRTFSYIFYGFEHTCVALTVI